MPEPIRKLLFDQIFSHFEVYSSDLNSMQQKKIFQKQERSFLVLLIWIFLLLLINPLFHGVWGTVFSLSTFSLVLLSSFFTLRVKPSFIVFGAILMTTSIFLTWLDFFVDHFLITIVELISSLCFMGFVIIILFRKIFFAENVKLNLLFGALSLYLLIGIFWALLYSSVEIFSPGAFLDIPEKTKSSPLSFQFFLYFSFVTQTTLGYGDITPLTALAKNLSFTQAILGQFYLATFVAGLVGMLLVKKQNIQKD